MAEIGLYNRAIGLVWGREPERALEILDAMAQRYPQSSQILEGQLESHLQKGDAEAALALMRRGIEIDPDNHRYWHNLFEVLLQRGEEDEALEALRGYHERWTCDVDARIEWANLTAKRVGRREQLAILEQGAAACDAEPKLQNDLAYVLATAVDPELRDAARAVALAEQAVAELGDNPLVLDTVAAAYASDGRMEEAVATARRALSLAERDRHPAVMRILRDHLARLEQGEPIRE